MDNINDLKLGINKILRSKFSNIAVHDEDIKQGFEKPCFFISVLNSYQKKEFNRRYRKNICFDIHYFSYKENVNNEFSNIADNLYEALEYVKINKNLYRANNMRHEVIDGVLHFFLNFNYHVFKRVEKESKMRNLMNGVNLKGEK